MNWGREARLVFVKLVVAAGIPNIALILIDFTNPTLRPPVWLGLLLSVFASVAGVLVAILVWPDVRASAGLKGKPGGR